MNREDVEAVLEREVRPQLRTHGGNIELMEVTEDGVVRFRLTGACAGCPAADITNDELVQAMLKEHVPGVRDAVLVQSVSEDLLVQARTLLGATCRMTVWSESATAADAIPAMTGRHWCEAWKAASPK